MGGAMLSLPVMPLWHAQGQYAFYYISQEVLLTQNQ